MDTDKNQEIENQESTDENTPQSEEVVDEKETAEQETVEEETAPETDDLSVALKELEELKDKHLRLQAEFDNYRRRTLKEKADLITSGGERSLKDLLPVVDDLERAMESIKSAQDVEAVKEGMELILNKFKDYLTKQGVAEIEAKDVAFDVDKHEAVAKFPAPSEEMKGKVIDVTKKGYTFNGKVIRYAQVVVGE
ncbi:MAG: nucleotide exchange factor GrpE [Bacteroidales bacterium]|nr:nucleotide exchange factor GrpE [Bacteroidales bacterium]